MSASPAFLTCIDLTASDRDKVRRVLDLFNEPGTVDELGLGPIRDFLSDALFPGTSVLPTRRKRGRMGFCGAATGPSVWRVCRRKGRGSSLIRYG